MTIVFPISNVIVKGVVVCTVASSFATSLPLTNDHIAPVSNIAGNANLWVLTGKYNRPHCILMLLNYDLSTFPAYLISTYYISFPAPFWSSCLYYLASLYYYWVVASGEVFTCCAGAYVVHLDNTWLYV